MRSGKDPFKRMETKGPDWKDILGKHISDKLLKPEYVKNSQKLVTENRQPI